jgi:restriction system protein
MHENSLFAVLLRSSWWISFAIAAAVTAVAIALLPDAYRPFAVLTSSPFLVIGCIAAWRQLRAPSSARVSNTLAAVRSMSWPEFSRAIETAYREQGYAVAAIDGAAANFEITKDGRTALVHCKRWKAAHVAIDALRELHEMKEARNASQCIYVATGEITAAARAYAAKHGIRIVDGPELSRLLPAGGRRGRR